MLSDQRQADNANPKQVYRLDLANQNLQNKYTHASEPTSIQSDSSPKENGTLYQNWPQSKGAGSQPSSNTYFPVDKQILAVSSGGSYFNGNTKDQTSPTTQTNMTNLSSIQNTNLTVQNQGNQSVFFGGVQAHLTNQHLKSFQGNSVVSHVLKDSAQSQKEGNVILTKEPQSKSAEGVDCSLQLNTGSSVGKLAQNVQMKRIPSVQKVNDKSAGRRHQKQGFGTLNTNQQNQDPKQPDINEFYSQQSQSKSHSRGTSQTNRPIPQNMQQPFVQQNLMQGMSSNGFNQGYTFTEGIQTQEGQFQNFNFVQMNQQPFQFATPMTGGHLIGQQAILTPAQIANQMNAPQWQPQPQVHFIAKQQKFYGISPDRAPMLFNSQAVNGVSEKRPYTSSGNMIKNRSGTTGNHKVSQTNSAIAALYLGAAKTHQNGFNLPQNQIRNASQPASDVQQVGQQLGYNSNQKTTFSMNQIPSKRQVVNVNNRSQVQGANSANNPSRKTNAIVQKENEQLYEEAIRFKQLANQHKEENIKLKTKIKILESENGRKERTIEDFYTQNQFIAQAQKNININGQLAPIAQTAQRYQQETFLVISLKKQVKEMKIELLKRDEELANNKRNIKATKLFEMEQEIIIYKDECIRLRMILEQNFQQNNQKKLAHHQSLQNAQIAEKSPLTQGKITSSASYSEAVNRAQDVNAFTQQQSQEFVSLQKKDDSALTNQSLYGNQIHNLNDGSNFNALEQTQTSGFNIFTSLGNDANKNLTDEVITQLQSQMHEKDLLIQHLQAQIDDFYAKKDGSFDGLDKSKDEEKKQKLEIGKLKKSIKDKDKEVTKLKSENSQLLQKTTNIEEEALKVKQMQATYSKRTKELLQEIKNKNEKIEVITKELQSANDTVKSLNEKDKQKSQDMRKFQQKIDELNKQLEDSKISKVTEIQEKSKEDKTSNQQVQQNLVEEQEAQSNCKNDDSKKKLMQLREKVFDELNIVCSIIGRKEELDRVDLTHLLKANQEVSYLEVSQDLQEFLQTCSLEELPHFIPRYALGSEERDRIIMHKLRKIVNNQEMLQILDEKENDDNLPFDALKELCEKFNQPFSDEQCSFICANFLRKIYQGTVFINFSAFLGALKADQKKTVLKDSIVTTLDAQETKPITLEPSEESENEKPQSNNEQKKLPQKNLRERKNLDEEQMLDIAESCFIKMAELLLEKGKSIRAVFGKYSVPEIFPDRTVLELLSPLSFLEGVKELGLDDLQEIEAACLMRVLAKPELENAIILNELVLIMENFGVADLDEDAEDDYIPDTEVDEEKKSQQDNVEIQLENQIDTTTKSKEEKKTKKRVHNLKNIDEKGIKILRKLARFLLKQFLHPREFFGKAIYKEQIKTKKREFRLDVLKIKDFYLRIKIASIRKRISENQSINDELCVDKKNQNQILNVKNLVKALEEIAEEEQALLMKEEEVLREANAQEKLAVSPDAEILSPTQTSIQQAQKKPIEGKIEVGKIKKDKKTPTDNLADYYSAPTQGEAIKFGITKNDASKVARIGGYMHLNTIEEEKHETQTSNYFEGASERDDSRLMGSNHLRHSNHTKDFEIDDETKRSAQKMAPDFFNKSLTKEDMAKLQFTTRSTGDNLEVDGVKKKFSQSVADASLRQFRKSQQSEVFENASDNSLNGSPPTKAVLQKLNSERQDNSDKSK